MTTTPLDTEVFAPPFRLSDEVCIDDAHNDWSILGAGCSEAAGPVRNAAFDAAVARARGRIDSWILAFFKEGSRFELDQEARYLLGDDGLDWYTDPVD